MFMCGHVPEDVWQTHEPTEQKFRHKKVNETITIVTFLQYSGQVR